MKKILCLSSLIFGTTCMPFLFGTDFDDTVKKIEEAIAGRKYDVVDKQSQEILKQSTDDAQKARIYALLGDSFEKQRKLPEALKSYTSALELVKVPDTKKTYSLKVADLILKSAAYERYSEMIRFLSVARDSAANPEEKTSLTMRLAEAKLNGQYLEDAVVLLQELIKAPETPAADRFSAQIMIGDFYSSPALRRSGNLRQSLKEYQSALQMPGLSVEQQFKAKKTIALTYSKCNEFRPAIEDCLEAAKLPGLPVDLQ
ncbi:MAG: DUF2225 domain-containing protein, partial [Lentisphaerota bacterium]